MNLFTETNTRNSADKPHPEGQDKVTRIATEAVQLASRHRGAPSPARGFSFWMVFLAICLSLFLFALEMVKLDSFLPDLTLLNGPLRLLFPRSCQPSCRLCTGETLSGCHRRTPWHPLVSSPQVGGSPRFVYHFLSFIVVSIAPL